MNYQDYERICDEYYFDNSGYEEAPGTEKNDCGVRALTVAADIDYEEARAVWTDCFREKDQGADGEMLTFLVLTKYRGSRFLHKFSYITIKQFIDRIRKIKRYRSSFSLDCMVMLLPSFLIISVGNTRWLIMKNTQQM